MEITVKDKLLGTFFCEITNFHYAGRLIGEKALCTCKGS